MDDIPLPDGEYAICEFFGHTTMVGRIAEIERFGTKMLALEPIFNGTLLPAVFHGGAAIYRMTPCTREVAWKRQATQGYQLPPAVVATIPQEQLPAPRFAYEERSAGELGESEGVGGVEF